MTTRETFVLAMETLGETFGRPLTVLALDAYWTALGDVPPAMIQAALKRALLECKFMPPPSELREFALGKDWKARQESARMVAATNAHLKQLMGLHATAEEIAKSRQEVGLVVRRLAESKSVATLAPPKQAVITEDEKQQAISRMETDLGR